MEVKALELKRTKLREARNKLKKKICLSKIKLVKKAGVQEKAWTKKDLFNQLYHCIYYVRYVDEYLIAIKGSKQLAKQIKKKTEDFLKSNLYFDFKVNKLIYGKDNKASFLGFDLKISGRKDRAIAKTRKILSFKKIKNKIFTRKQAMEARFEKVITKIYESQKLKALKALIKGEKRKGINKSVAKYLAIKDAKELVKEIEISGMKWFYDKEPFES